MNKSQSLHYFKEHLSCKRYLSGKDAGFAYWELEAGTPIVLDSSMHHLLIFLEGGCVISCERFKNRAFSGGEMVLVPMAATFFGKVPRKLRFVDMRFTVPISCCDKMVLQSYSHFKPKIHYDFRPLPVRKPLPEFCEILAYGLESGMYCKYFHEMKHKELFFYLRGYYSKEEITELLYPVLSRSMDFKMFILQNYRKVDSLENLVTLSNMSKRTFFRKFKQEFDMTVHKWMVKQTCNDIIHELSGEKANLMETAEKLGFGTASSFCNFCKRNIGYAPTELAIKCRNGEVIPDEIVRDIYGNSPSIQAERLEKL